MLNQAVTHHQAGRLQEAERLYRLILGTQPTHPDANHNLGVVAAQTGRSIDGLPYFKAALTANPGHEQYLLSYAEALLATGQMKNAADTLKAGMARGLNTKNIQALLRRTEGVLPQADFSNNEIPSTAEINQLVTLFNAGLHLELESQARLLLKKYPESGFIWKALGASLQMQGLEALSVLQKAAELMPGDHEAHNNLGNALKKCGRLNNAISSYQRALEINPGYAEAHNNLGNALKDIGQLDSAISSYQRALEINLGYAEAHNNLGNALKDLGQPDNAISSYQHALEINPGYAEAHNNLGNALKDLGQLDSAISNYRQAIQIKPSLADAHNNLGNALKDIGQLENAVSCYQRALEINPNFAEAYNNLGNIFCHIGQLEKAVASHRKAIEIKPDYAEAYNSLGNALHEIKRLDDAIANYQKALKLNSNYAEAHNNLGNALKDIGQLNSALTSYQQALAIKPDYAEALNNIGNTLNGLGKLKDAVISYQHAISIDPDFAEAHNNLGNTFNTLGQLDQAVESHHRALKINPNYAEAHNSLGNVLNELGMLDNAIASYQQALECKQEFSEALSNLLFVYNYKPDLPVTTLLAEARRFGDLVARRAQPYIEWPNLPEVERCLRVGFVSGDLRNHPVGYFVENIMAALSSQASARVTLIAYPTHIYSDELSERIKKSCQGWHSAVGLSDERFSQQIRDDGIDILIDLSGHTAHNRLPLFAWKPAPVQVSWLGYFATTGVSAIDYFIADPWTLPEEEEGSFTEKIWRLPNTRLCFTPPDAEVPIAPLPALSNGYVTFGCFNNLTKMNDAVVSVWIRILKAIPSSRLFLKSRQLKETSMRAHVIQRFANHGIAHERLIIEGSGARSDYLAAYNRVDIALDPFPFPGGTTSVEGLWMGVPMLTMSGERFLSRQGVGFLMNVALPEWIAINSDDYVVRAVSHAENLQYLAALRDKLRHQVLASPLFDAAHFANDFETALRGMWVEWCNRQLNPPVTER